MFTFWKQSVPGSSSDSGSCSAGWFRPRSASSLSASSDNSWRDRKLSMLTCWVFTCLLGDFFDLLLLGRPPEALAFPPPRTTLTAVGAPMRLRGDPFFLLLGAFRFFSSASSVISRSFSAFMAALRSCRTCRLSSSSVLWSSDSDSDESSAAGSSSGWFSSPPVRCSGSSSVSVAFRVWISTSAPSSWASRPWLFIMAYALGAFFLRLYAVRSLHFWAMCKLVQVHSSTTTGGLK